MGIFSDQEGGCPDCVRGHPTGAQCLLCMRKIARDPLQYGSAEQKTKLLKKLNADETARAEWKASLTEIKSLPPNGKTSGCHSAPIRD